MTTLDSLVEAALALPSDERLELASRLWASLSDEELTEAARSNRELLDVARRRAEELSSGAVEGVPFDEAIDRAIRAQQ